jgi:hypothetical protein
MHRKTTGGSLSLGPPEGAPIFAHPAIIARTSTKQYLCPGRLPAIGLTIIVICKLTSFFVELPICTLNHRTFAVF